MAAVYTTPERAFHELVARPRWLVACLVVLAVTVGSTLAIHPLIVEMQQEEVRDNPRLTPEQAERALEGMRFMEGNLGRFITVGAAALSTLLALVVIAAVLLFGGNFLLGGESDFRTLFAMTCHVQLVGLAKSLLTIPLMLAKNSMYVATSLQVLLPPDQWRRPISVLLAGVSDIFTLWMLGLTILGVAAAYRWRTSKAAGLVIALYVVYLLGSAGLVALVGGLGS